MIPILYRNLPPRSIIMIDRYRTIFNTRRFDTDLNEGVDRTEIAADVVYQEIILETYRGTHDTSLTFPYAGGQLPEGRARLPTYLRPFTINPRVLFRTATPMVQITGKSGTHRENEGNVHVKCGNINPSSKYA